MPAPAGKTVLIIGASRGLGYPLAAEYLARGFDLLFVNAGVANGPRETVADVSTDTFVRLMVTKCAEPRSPRTSPIRDLRPYSGLPPCREG